MEVVNKETEDANKMADQATMSISTTPMQSSACLAAKPKKLMETEPTLVPMMIETKIQAMEVDDPKKRAWALTPLAGMTAPATTSTQIQPLEIKKTRNNKTPPRTSYKSQHGTTHDVTMSEAMRALAVPYTGGWFV